MTIEVYGVEQLLRDLREYTCPVHGCDAALSGGGLMCRGHWRLVASDQKREVYEVVRKLERIASRYDTAQDGSPRQARLADEWLAAEVVCREVQLRAVILASERAGARPDEPLGSARKQSPRQEERMGQEITVVQEDGCAKVLVANGAGETVSEQLLENGQKVTLSVASETTAPTSETAGTTAGEITVGPVCDSETGEPIAVEEPPVEEPPAGEGQGGEPAGQGEGEQPTTSGCTAMPLYVVTGESIPEGFSASGLETPDGKTLFHFAGDTGGQAATGNADAVSVYADADDDTKPVVAVPVAGGEGAGESSASEGTQP